VFRIDADPLDTAALRAALDDHAAGALVVFEGRVRNENDGRAVTSLEYEAYESMCLRHGEAILAAARRRFGVRDVRCVHRVGHLALGDVAVWLGVTDGHREAAFAACRWVIDEIKRELPIWKREHYVDGPAEWVRCEACAHGGDPDHHHGDARP
jgi:molybdopterin synthase catalytic subunit